MEKSLSKPQDQVQAIYLAQANIFSYEASKSAKSWVPLCDSTVPISILYDNIRSIYRIISVDADIKEVVVNTTVAPDLEFVKTTQKFGYWKDVSSGRVFGIGFASEYEAEAFDECLRKIKQSLGSPLVNSSVNLNQDSLRAEDNSSAYQPPRIQLNDSSILQGQGDGPSKSQEQKNKLSWEDYDQVTPSVLNFLRNNRQTTIPPVPVTASDRPRTYKVDLPIIPSPSQAQSLASSSTQAQPSYHQQTLPFPYFPGNVPIEVMQFPMPSYNYQGPPPFRRLPTGSGAPSEEKSGQNPAGADFGERRELIDEINRLRNENVKLSQSLIESTCSGKKWEVQVNSLRDDNIQLVKSVADGNARLESLMREVRDNKEQANRWKEHYNQAMSSIKEKGQQLRDAEDKLRHISTDKSRVELVLKDLEDELKRQQQISKEQQTNGHAAGQYTNKYFKELEEHYRKLLSDSQKRIEEILRKDSDRKNVLRGVDTLFTGAIQGLINIHGQIRQAYEQ